MNQNVDKLIIPIDKLKYKKTRILQYDELKFLSDITINQYASGGPRIFQCQLYSELTHVADGHPFVRRNAWTNCAGDSLDS